MQAYKYKQTNTGTHTHKLVQALAHAKSLLLSILTVLWVSVINSDEYSIKSCHSALYHFILIELDI